MATLYDSGEPLHQERDVEVIVEPEDDALANVDHFYVFLLLQSEEISHYDWVEKKSLMPDKKRKIGHDGCLAQGVT